MQSAPMERTAIDDAYDNGMHFPDVPQWRDRWKQRDLERVPGPGEKLDIAYGPGGMQRLDVLPNPASSRSPTAIFFHGGFWSRNSKETFRFLAPGFHAAGLNVVFAGYSLAPQARMGTIVSDAGGATQWLAAHMSELGLRASALVVVGWSAGAHLAALQMSEPNVSAGLGISGVYDLEPFSKSAMNQTLGLDEQDVSLYSPALHLKPDARPFTVAFGGAELPAYRQQSVDYHRALSDAHIPTSLIELAGRHHHSVLDEIFSPGGLLIGKLSEMAAAVLPP